MIHSLKEKNKTVKTGRNEQLTRTRPFKAHNPVSRAKLADAMRVLSCCSDDGSEKTRVYSIHRPNLFSRHSYRVFPWYCPNPGSLKHFVINREIRAYLPPLPSMMK